MLHALLADLVMLAHFAFVVFVAAGGFLALWRRAVAWAHVPCALYGAAVELVGWVCPLTPLEVRLRRAAGEAGYTGSFVEEYLGGLLYPAGWEEVHVWLGVAVLLGNAAIYGWVLRRRVRTAGPESG